MSDPYKPLGGYMAPALEETRRAVPRSDVDQLFRKNLRKKPLAHQPNYYDETREGYAHEYVEDDETGVPGMADVRARILRNTMMERFKREFAKRYKRKMNEKEIQVLWARIDDEMTRYGVGGGEDELIGKTVDRDPISDLGI